MSYIKVIPKEELNLLFTNGILKNTKNGFVDCSNGKIIGHYKTLGCAKKMYIEDKYANIAEKIYRKKIGEKSG